MLVAFWHEGSKKNNFFKVTEVVLSGLIFLGGFGKTHSFKSVFQVLTEESGDALYEN